MMAMISQDASVTWFRVPNYALRHVVKCFCLDLNTQNRLVLLIGQASLLKIILHLNCKDIQGIAKFSSRQALQLSHVNGQKFHQQGNTITWY